MGLNSTASSRTATTATTEPAWAKQRIIRTSQAVLYLVTNGPIVGIKAIQRYKRK